MARIHRRTLLKALAGVAVSGTCAGAGLHFFLAQESFGAIPEGDALRRIISSPNYVGGEFRNLIPGPILNDDESFVIALLRSLVTKKEQPAPPHPVPFLRVNLRSLNRNEDSVVWLGHSSFLIHLGGLRILIDPVFSPYAAPVSFSTRAFEGATPYSVGDMPDIDCLLISHDHRDHLDYPTIMGLKERIGVVVCGLGVGAHFRRWGFPEHRILEADWGDVVPLSPEFRAHVTTAHHYSGRSLTRNKSLWAGFLLESPGKKVFFSGDSGYGPHFADLGKKSGGVDLALLDCGQYNERWSRIHMTPEEAARAAEELGARALLPAHIGKFSLAYHAWDEPFERITAASRGKPFQLTTPLIGAPLRLTDTLPDSDPWWRQIGTSS